MNPGEYIVIEGIDGSCKTTQRDLLAESLKEDGYEVDVISEPGGTPIGSEIRGILKNASLERSPESNFDLFTICRREIALQVLPKLAMRGCVAISDRNWFSSVAYQGYGEGHSVDTIIERSKSALGQYAFPDRMIIIDLPLEAIAERLEQRGGASQDYFDSKGLDYFRKVSDGYKWLASWNQVSVVDGSKGISEVQADIQELLK